MKKVLDFLYVRRKHCSRRGLNVKDKAYISPKKVNCRAAQEDMECKRS